MNDYADRDGLIERLQSWDVDIDEFLSQSQESERQRLTAELEDVNHQLEARDDIHSEIVEELEWKVERYTDRLESLYKTGRGRNDGKRERMKDRVERFYEKLRREKRQQWRDRQELEHERREIRRELQELEDDSLSELI